jgi:hypothetical protein
VCGGVSCDGRRHGADEFTLCAHAFCVVSCLYEVCECDRACSVRYPGVWRYGWYHSCVFGRLCVGEFFVSVDVMVRMSSPCTHMLSVLFDAHTMCADVIERAVRSIQACNGSAGIVLVWLDGCVWGGIM